MPPVPSVTLETKCWERDWRLLLTTDRLSVLAERNCFDFAERTLMINNVADRARVCRHAQRAVDRGVITSYIVVEEHAAAALDFFRLTREDFTTGYHYSIAELVSLYLCRTDYLLHYAGDCLPVASRSWIPAALQYLASRDDLRVANLTWDSRYDEAERESSFQTEDFYVGYGFSDQCYLVRTSDFRAPIYGDVHPASARYPDYGGELFEKRVDAWMRHHRYLRATFKHAAYAHLGPPTSWRSRVSQRSFEWLRRARARVTG